jgi:hypothetical protein
MANAFSAPSKSRARIFLPYGSNWAVRIGAMAPTGVTVNMVLDESIRLTCFGYPTISPSSTGESSLASIRVAKLNGPQ